jgi:hypothetical protein
MKTLKSSIVILIVALMALLALNVYVEISGYECNQQPTSQYPPYEVIPGHHFVKK